MDRVAYTPKITLDGRLPEPPVVTICCVVAWNFGGSGKSCIEAASWAEAWTKYYDGVRRGLYGSYYDTYERQGVTPENFAAYRKERARIESRSCVLLEDYLKMRVYVRNLPAERVNEICESWYKGQAGATAFLREQISHKRAECARRGIFPEPDPRFWWEKGRPWNISTP